MYAICKGFKQPVETVQAKQHKDPNRKKKRGENA